MPEWSNGPHSKCGERVTVPGVRIPLSPQDQTKQEDVERHLFVFIPTCKLACERRYKEQKGLLSSFLLSVGLAGAPAASRRERR